MTTCISIRGMKQIGGALAAASLAIVAAAIIAGRPHFTNEVKPRIQTAASPIRMSAAVVRATPPSVSELLDIILGDRGTAGYLAGGKGASLPLGSEEERVASVLRRYTRDARRANRIATALVREGRRRNVGSTLLVGVLLTENPWLDPRAKSFVGARGLMQVMPFHAGQWGCASSDLFDIESNMCHGVAILAQNIRQAKTLPQALLGYNGCVRGTNTPDCWRYPSKVFRLARLGAAAGGTPPDLMPFSVRSLGPRKVRNGAPLVRRGNILLPRELLVE